MDIETQLKQIIDESVIENTDENEEVEVSWIVEQSQLSDDEKLNKLKELAQYSISDEFKALIKQFKDKIPQLHIDIRHIVNTRTETKATKSILDEYVASLEATQEIAEATTCKILKEYLIKARCEAFNSAILNKKGIVERGEMAVHFDMPVYSEIDIIKEKATIYNSVEQFLKFCISIYDYKGIMERKNGKVEDNPHQPYD